MDADERQIYHYLKQRKQEFVCRREISRDAAGKRRCRYAPEWADAPLDRMVERGILDCDGKDAFRLRPPPESATKRRFYVSPQIARILNNSGKDFAQLTTNQDEDDYYDKL